MILFLEMSILQLDQSVKDSVILKLDDGLKETYQKYKPQELLPSEAKTKGIISSNAIITGVPKLVDSQSDFKGFILFPMQIGDVTTFMMIPLIDQYDVYEIRDEETSETFLIAHLKDSEKIPNKKIMIGGVLKELQTDEKENKSNGIFLKAIYHIDI
jgi:hypothetical protein